MSTFYDTIHLSENFSIFVIYFGHFLNVLWAFCKACLHILFSQVFSALQSIFEEFILFWSTTVGASKMHPNAKMECGNSVLVAVLKLVLNLSYILSLNLISLLDKKKQNLMIKTLSRILTSILLLFAQAKILSDDMWENFNLKQKCRDWSKIDEWLRGD